MKQNLTLIETGAFTLPEDTLLFDLIEAGGHFWGWEMRAEKRTPSIVKLDPTTGELTPIWGGGHHLTADKQYLWWIDKDGVVRADVASMTPTRFGLPAPPQLLTAVDSGALLGWSDHDDPEQEGQVAFLNTGGNLVWSRTLPAGSELVRIISAGSERCLAVCCERHGLGASYLLDTRTGTIVYEGDRGPHGDCLGLANGSALIGYQGYDDFHTLRVSSEGKQLDRWSSHGLSWMTEEGRLMAVEMRNTNEPMHLVEWKPGGEVTKGPELSGYYTSNLLAVEDGSRLFWRDHVLYRCRPDLRLEQLAFAPDTEKSERSGVGTSARLAGSAPGQLVLIRDESAIRHGLAWARQIVQVYEALI